MTLKKKDGVHQKMIKNKDIRKKYVYQLVNENNIVEYVGESFNPHSRFKQHTKKKFRPKKGCGKFYGRTDLSLQILAEFENHKEAFDYQCQLQTKYFGIDDRERARENGIKGGQYGYLGNIAKQKRAGIIKSIPKNF